MTIHFEPTPPPAPDPLPRLFWILRVSPYPLETNRTLLFDEVCTATLSTEVCECDDALYPTTTDVLTWTDQAGMVGTGCPRCLPGDDYIRVVAYDAPGGPFDFSLLYKDKAPDAPLISPANPNIPTNTHQHHPVAGLSVVHEEDLPTVARERAAKGLNVIECEGCDKTFDPDRLIWR